MLTWPGTMFGATGDSKVTLLILSMGPSSSLVWYYGAALIQLILPYTISCIRGSLEIPSLGLPYLFPRRYLGQTALGIISYLGLPALHTKNDQWLPALGNKKDQGLPALGPKKHLGLAALGTFLVGLADFDLVCLIV